MRAQIHNHKYFIIICLLFILLPLVAFWRNFDISGVNTTYFGGEFVGGYYPEFSLGMDSFWKFRDMLWDPYNLLGIPHMGAVDRLGFFYPVKFIFYLIGSFIPLNYRLFLISYFSIFHISLAGIFMYIFSRRVLKLAIFASLIVGVIFAFNGSIVRFVAFPNHILGIAYLPLILYFLHSAITTKSLIKCLLAGMFISPALLSGYTPFFIYNNLFAFLFLLTTSGKLKKEFATVVIYLTIANIFAFTLSAPALLPNLENASMSERTAYNLGGSSANPYNPLMFIHYIFPGFFMANAGTSGIILGYVGITSLVLAFLAIVGNKNKYLFIAAILALFFFVLSLGNFTFLHQLAYLIVPKYKYFRFPGSMHYIVAFCVACMAGFGLETLQQKRHLLNSVKIPLMLISTVFISLLLLTYVLKIVFAGTEKVDTAISSMLITNLFFFASLVTIYAINHYPQVNRYRVILFFIICLQLFNVVAMPGSVNSDLDPRVVNGPNEITTWLRTNTKDDYSRVYLKDSNIRYNAANLKLYQIDGYFSMTPKTLSLLFSPFVDSSTGGYLPDSKVLDLAGVKYIVSEEDLDLKLYTNIKKVKAFTVEQVNYGQFMDWKGTMLPVGTTVYIYENVNFLPKLLFFTKMEKAFSDEQATDLFQKNNDLNTAVLTLNPSDSGVGLINETNVKPASIVTLTKYSNTEITALTVTNVPGILVLNDLYYPSWKAEIDGSNTQVLKANVAFRGVYLPKGSHTVRFYYHPQWLYLGIGISSVSVILFIVLLIVYFKKCSHDHS